MTNNKYLSKFYFLKDDFFSQSISVRYVLSFFFNVYLFIVLFDVTRDGFYIPHIVNLLVSALRDVSIYSILIFILISKQGKLLNKYSIFIFFMIFIPIIMNISQVGLLIEEGQKIKYVIQFCILFAKPWMFLFILVNIDIFYVFDKQKILLSFINFSLFIIVFSFLIHFCFPGLKTSTYNIANRVGLGNMSIQTGIYFSSFVLTLYYKPFKSNLKNGLAIFLLIVAILLSVTSTGVVCLLIALIGFLFDTRTKKTSFVLLLIFLLLITVVVVIFFDKFESFFSYFFKKADEFWDLFINIFNQENHKTKSSSFRARERQIASFKESLTLDNCIFGFGYFSQTTEMIENGYFAILHDFGIYGLGIMLFILIWHGMLGLIDFFKYKSVLKIISVIGLSLYCVTLNVAIVPSIATSFVILFYYSFWGDCII